MNEIDHAFIDALAEPHGAVPNGPTFTRPRGTYGTVVLPGNGTVVTVRPGVQGWACDDCDTDGFGPAEMYEHATATNHHRYTAV